MAQGEKKALGSLEPPARQSLSDGGCASFICLILANFIHRRLYAKCQRYHDARPDYPLA
jgi:hypothetical protein